jgi:hypothetical protein
MRFGAPEAAAVDEHGSLEENAEILKSFELKQEAKKKKLIEMAKVAKSPSQEGTAGPLQVMAQSKSEVERNNEEKLNSFLISKQQVQSRILQSANFVSKPKQAKDEGDDDIFRELDEEGADDFHGQELGYRGQQDSEHEDSEEVDVAPEKSDEIDDKGYNDDADQ